MNLPRAFVRNIRFSNLDPVTDADIEWGQVHLQLKSTAHSALKLADRDASPEAFREQLVGNELNRLGTFGPSFFQSVAILCLAQSLCCN